MSEQQRVDHKKRKSGGGGGGSTSGYKGKGKAATKQEYPKKVKDNGEEGVGVSKIKAALRQTRRLLAKDNLSASVRQEAERKLIALQDEISAKETQQTERKNAQRSHKIRFFERQKLVRRIKKLKKSSDDEDVEKELLEARVLLNYVLHYPMTQKYLALFPNQGPSITSQDDDEAEEQETSTNSSEEQSSKVKERIRKLMKKGDLSNEPELELETRTKVGEETIQRKRLMQEEDIEPKKTAKKEHRKSNIEGDDFFADSDE